MAQVKSFFSRYFFSIAVIGLYLFLYIPLFVLIFFSFNDSQSSFHFGGFSLRWYRELFASTEIWEALLNSLIVAVSAVTLSITMGMLLIFYSPNNRFFNKLFLMFYGNLAIPEIVIAVGMLSFFSYLSVPLGLTTLIAGHTILGLGYVVPILHSRYSELSGKYTEASLDLGATRGQTLLKIIMPLLSPALLASALIVFIISLDDFVISFFCSGAASQTLPIYIFSMIRVGASPVVSALSTLLLLASSVLVIAYSSLQF
ncbi:MAG: ABC transporter permease, partial [Rickettsia endosymbiont of Ixodes persulcatus]|nr:ABC transporter permease [Rickettsia endosymbiont of Ixodes persulcatus]